MGRASAFSRERVDRVPFYVDGRGGELSRAERSERAIGTAGTAGTAVLGCARLGSAGLGAVAATFCSLRYSILGEAPLALSLGTWRHSARPLGQWQNQVCARVQG